MVSFINKYKQILRNVFHQIMFDTSAHFSCGKKNEEDILKYLKNLLIVSVFYLKWTISVELCKFSQTVPYYWQIPHIFTFNIYILE